MSYMHQKGSPKRWKNASGMEKYDVSPEIPGVQMFDLFGCCYTGDGHPWESSVDDHFTM